MRLCIYHMQRLYLPLMKKFALLFFLMCVSCAMSMAQEIETGTGSPDTTAIKTISSQPIIIGGSNKATDIFVYDEYRSGKTAPIDSLHLPLLNRFGQTYINMYPYSWFGLYDWELHKGLNLSLGASVFATFGDGPWKGAGFTQNIAAMYAVPITDKLSFAIGGYMNNLYWSHDAYRDAGLNAVLGYKFNEHWEGYIFGQKSLVNKNMPMPLYDMSRIGDRIGAAIKYNFNPQFSIQVTVETEKRP